MFAESFPGLGGVDFGWGEEVGDVVDHGDLPVASVDEVVVGSAEHDAVVDVGFAGGAVGEVFLDVVGVGPGHGGVA